ncbi:MAG: ATP-binding protein [Candidatus Heimdallarchaeaceae archaeon]
MSEIENLQPIGIVYGKTDPFSVRVLKLRDTPIIKIGQLVLFQDFQNNNNEVKKADILGRITWVSIDNKLLSSTDLIPNISQSQVKDRIVMNNIKYAQSVASDTTFEVQLIGKFREQKLIRPRAPIIAGQLVFLADSKFLEEQLYRDNTIEIGILRDNPGVKALIDFNKLITHHFSVLAMTGAGKSYTVGVIIEELVSKYDVPILIIDPHGEYAKTAVANDVDDDIAVEIANSVQVFVPGDIDSYIEQKFKKETGKKRPIQAFKLNPKDMELYQVKTLLKEYYGLSEAQSRELDENWDKIRDMEFSKVDQLVEEVCFDIKHKGTKKALESKLKALLRKPYFQLGIDIPLERLIAKGRISILELTNLDIFDQQAVIGIILRKLFESRKSRSQTRVKPFLTIIEEAHNFIPGGTTHSASKYILSRIASEGRKFGIGIGIVSQRPYRVDADVLSQCNTHFILRIMNPKDQNYVKNICEYMTEEDAKSLRGQAQGEVMVIGYATPFTLLVKVKKRRTMHGGITPDFIEELGRE